MAAAYAYLRDVKPYKTSWKVQVKVLHSWKTYSTRFGETFDMVLADVQGTKIHASVKKDLIHRFENKIIPGQWRTIENFGLSIATGQFKPTNHRFKMSFITKTNVTRMESLSDDPYLTLSPFVSVLSGNLNENNLIDIVGQVINVGEMESIDVNNKPTKKISFELRDESDARLPCTLWGSFAEQVSSACDFGAFEMVICLVRFTKIKTYNDKRSISNAFNASQVAINPAYSQIVEFKNKLPNDGLAISLIEKKSSRQLPLVNCGEFYHQFPRRSIKDIFDMIEEAKVKLICTIYAIDCDWAWYYISCKRCNKKVIPIGSTNNSSVSLTKKPQFWCDGCRGHVTNVLARYKLHVKVMDQSGEMKLMLFDSMAAKIVGCSANSLIEGPFDEMEDPENLPDDIKHLQGKTFQFLVSVENENLWNELDIYKVSRVLSKDGVTDDDVIEESNGGDQPPDDSTGDQASLVSSSSQDISDSTTPLSKRSNDDFVSPNDHSSTTKRLCLDHINVVQIKREKLTKEEMIKEANKAKPQKKFGENVASSKKN